jgi:hypothetical protein
LAETVVAARSAPDENSRCSKWWSLLTKVRTYPAFTFAPIADVLTDEIFQEFRFASASAAADIQVLVAFGAGKG